MHRKYSLFLLSAIALSSCTTRYDPAVHGKRYVSSGPGYTVRAIQLDDAGLFADRNQYAEVFADAEQLRREGGTAVVFVHGWKHSADPADENLKQFETNVIAKLASQSGNPNDHLLGVYIGWRGATARGWLSQQLSFWNRKRTADEISGRHILKILTTLENIRSASEGRFRLVIVGHSFGARMIFETVAPFMLTNVMAAIPIDTPGYLEKIRAGLPSDETVKNLMQQRPDLQTVKRRVCGFGDLVVLINPAFEASRYHVLDDFRLSGQRFQSEQQPLLLIVSALNDRATRAWFPRGKWFEQVHRGAGPDFTCETLLTVGNFKRFRTHHLTEGEKTASSSASPPSRICAGAVADAITNYAPLEGERFGNAKLLNLADGAARNPFIVATADRELLDDHGDIFNKGFIDFFKAFVTEALSAEPCR